MASTFFPRGRSQARTRYRFSNQLSLTAARRPASLDGSTTLRSFFAERTPCGSPTPALLHAALRAPLQPRKTDRRKTSARNNTRAGRRTYHRRSGTGARGNARTPPLDADKTELTQMQSGRRILSGGCSRATFSGGDNFFSGKHADKRLDEGARIPGGTMILSWAMC
jgi:hypothetical protein